MKRWLSGLLAVMILFAGGLGLADEEGRTDADIQESMVSIEGQEMTAGDVTENIRFILDVLKDEEVRSLLKIQDVQDVLNEIVYKVLVWLIRNRPVTLKIIAELGMAEEDVRCVEKLWDSAERISAAFRAYDESGNGRKLQADLQAVREDPEIKEACEDFLELATMDDVNDLVEILDREIDEFRESLTSPDTEESGTAEQNREETAEGMLAQRAKDCGMDNGTAAGGTIIRLLEIVENSNWAQRAVPKLNANENLWRLMGDLAEGSPEIDQALREELSRLKADEDMQRFLKKAGYQVITLGRAMKGMTENETETNNAGEEAAP